MHGKSKLQSCLRTKCMPKQANEATESPPNPTPHHVTSCLAYIDPLIACTTILLCAPRSLTHTFVFILNPLLGGSENYRLMRVVGLKARRVEESSVRQSSDSEYANSLHDATHRIELVNRIYR
jgi:hypothetical protein